MAIGFWEVLVILAIILIIFGPKKVPELARSLGKAAGEFKKGQEESLQEKSTPHKKAKKKAG